MPDVAIVVPANWRVVAGQELGELVCDADTVRAALNWLIRKHPQFQSRLFSSGDQIASWVNVYLNNEDIRGLASLDTPIQGRTELVILPALAGG
jgi:molybdopterin converting factor small subunit